jgi:hypothetical protein
VYTVCRFSPVPLRETEEVEHAVSWGGFAQDEFCRLFFSPAGAVILWYFSVLYIYPKLKAIDEQADHEIVHPR